MIEKGKRVVSLRARAIGNRARALLGNYGQEQRGSTIERLRTIIMIRAVQDLRPSSLGLAGMIETIENNP